MLPNWRALALEHPDRKPSAKATKKLSDHIEDQFVGLVIKNEVLLSALCMKEVAEFQHVSTQPRRN